MHSDFLCTLLSCQGSHYQWPCHRDNIVNTKPLHLHSFAALILYFDLGLPGRIYFCFLLCIYCRDSLLTATAIPPSKLLYLLLHHFLFSIHHLAFSSFACSLLLAHPLIFSLFFHLSPSPYCLLHPNSLVCVSSAVRQRHHITWQVGRLTLSCTSLDPHCSPANPTSVAVRGNICYFNYQNDVF